MTYSPGSNDRVQLMLFERSEAVGSVHMICRPAKDSISEGQSVTSGAVVSTVHGGTTHETRSKDRVHNTSDQVLLQRLMMFYTMHTWAKWRLILPSRHFVLFPTIVYSFQNVYKGNNCKHHNFMSLLNTGCNLIMLLFDVKSKEIKGRKQIHYFGTTKVSPGAVLYM